jgi:hypothetical protein
MDQQLSMQKRDTVTTTTTTSVNQYLAGKPSVPSIGRQSYMETKVKDPSSSPKSDRYPVSPLNYRLAI